MTAGTDILFLVHRAPWPPDRGDRIRSWHIAERLMRIAPTHIVAFADDAADLVAAQEKLAPLAASLTIEQRRSGRVSAMLRAIAGRLPASVPLFASAGLQARVDALLASGRIGTIVVFSSQMAQFIPARCSVPVIMDFVDVDSAKFSAYAAQDGFGPMRWVHAREGRLLARWEAAVADRAAHAVFVSEAEAALFRSRYHGPASRVLAIENGIDLVRFDPAAPMASITPPAGPLAVFTGQMDYRPNVEAVQMFAQHILPALRARVPGAGFAIVGRAPTADVLALARIDGVTVTGEVPDTRPWLAAADAVVAPLAVARGVQNKLLEAMAMARPVVASPAAALGIDAVPGQALHVADTPDQWVDACAALFADPAAAAAMGTAARARMVARYGWEATLAPLEALLRGQVAHG